MKKLLLALSMVLASSGVNAANTLPGTIGALTISDGGNLFFTTTSAGINPASCSASSYVIPGVNAQFKNYYAMLLTAQASGQDVVISISNTQCINLGGARYPRVLLVQQRAG